MSEMVERVTEAMRAHIGRLGVLECAEMGVCIDGALARAAIEAMRPPKRAGFLPNIEDMIVSEWIDEALR